MIPKFLFTSLVTGVGRASVCSMRTIATAFMATILVCLLLSPPGVIAFWPQTQPTLYGAEGTKAIKRVYCFNDCLLIQCACKPLRLPCLCACSPWTC